MVRRNEKHNRIWTQQLDCNAFWTVRSGGNADVKVTTLNAAIHHLRVTNVEDDIGVGNGRSEVCQHSRKNIVAKGHVGGHREAASLTLAMLLHLNLKLIDQIEQRQSR